MKRLLFLRHGEADHPPTVVFPSDAERTLNAPGRRKMERQALGLKALGIGIDAIVTSPYTRTRQTADIVAAAYGLSDAVLEDDGLAPGATLREIRRAVKHLDGEAVLIVGHAPDLGEAVGELTGGAAVALGKGWLAWVELMDETPRAGAGRLKALLPAHLPYEAGQ